GVLGVWRVDAAGIAGLAVLGTGGLALARIAAAGILPAGQPERARLARGRRLVFACLAFVAVSRLPDLSVRGLLAAHQSATGIVHLGAQHGTGHMLWHNLYLSYSAV